MKFNYTKQLNGTDYQASFDISCAKHWHMVGTEEAPVLEIVTNLGTVDVFRPKPNYGKQNKDGTVKITGYGTAIVQEPITFTITVPEEQEAFVTAWEEYHGN